jgi:outer membrane receptor protein involved in Fe transport
MFDLSANWNLNDTFSLRAGIDNVFDKSPASTGKTLGRPAGTNLSAVCGGAPGCQNPTGYSIGNSGSGTTNSGFAGFYDTIGRSYFVGVKARF